jgi:hypothetical protein
MAGNSGRVNLQGKGLLSKVFPGWEMQPLPIVVNHLAIAVRVSTARHGGGISSLSQAPDEYTATEISS